jgi:hypothetical protein
VQEVVAAGQTVAADEVGICTFEIGGRDHVAAEY